MTWLPSSSQRPASASTCALLIPQLGSSGEAQMKSARGVGVVVMGAGFQQLIATGSRQFGGLQAGLSYGSSRQQPEVGMQQA